MTWWSAGLWGLAGGGAIELVDLYKLVRTADGSYELPSGGRRFWGAYAIAVGVRLVLGFVAAWALESAGEIDSTIAALGVGAGATGFLEHLSRNARLSTSESVRGGR